MPKLIETSFPFARLSRIAEHESWRKEVYRPAYYIHKWWARRLGSVFRGILLGACLDESADFWNRFYGANDFHQTTVFDPFMGSGVTVGEAMKLGCRAIGRDINAVAVTTCQAAFADYDRKLVQATYRHLENTVAPTLMSYFQTRSAQGEPATVLYYFMVKVVDCPQCQQHIDLFKRRIFSANAVPKKDPSARALCPVCDAIVYTQYNASDAQCTHCKQHFNPQEGTVSGPQVRCPACHGAFKLVDLMRTREHPLDYRRYAKMILLQNGTKTYEAINDFDRELEKRIAEESSAVFAKLPRVPVEPGYNTNQMLKHNYQHWHELFSDRQIVCIRHLADAIKAIEPAEMRQLFSCLFSGTLEFNNLFVSFKGEGTGAVRHMFANHVLKPELMPIEANLWGTPKSSGAFSCLYQTRIERALDYKAFPTEVVLDSYSGAKSGGFNKPLSAPVVGSYETFGHHPGSVYISQGDSSSMDIPDGEIDLIVSDPPFFDNVHYSQLADFFYYWLNQLLDLSPVTTTRSAAEVQDTDAEQFTGKLTAVFTECRRLLRDDGLFVFTYHHARHDGWLAVHRAIRHAGFRCVNALPIKAEMAVSMPLQLANSPINIDLILVCRTIGSLEMPSLDIDPIHTAISEAEAQVAELTGNGIQVSLADAKVILMGRLLCGIHQFHGLDREEAFLEKIENDIDCYVVQVMREKGEFLYQASESQQLILFETMAQYLVNNDAARDGQEP